MPGSVLVAPPPEVVVTLSNVADSITVGSISVILSRAGLDGMIGTGDDVIVIPASVTLTGSNTIRVDLTGIVLPDDVYQIRVRGDEVAIPGRISYWKLDEGTGSTTADSSDGGYPGTIVGASWTTGRLGNALSFNGVDNHVTTGASSVSVPWTAALWVSREDSSWVDSRLLDGDTYSAESTSLRLEQYNNTNKVGFTQYTVGDYEFDYTAPIGEWTHLTFVGQASGTSLHVNGLPVGNHSASISLSRYHLGNQTFKGILDDVRLYDRVLTSTEILALARLGGAVRDTAGALLDGEFDGAFPSGDGVPGGDFVATFMINANAPPAPTNLVAVPLDGRQIALAWQDNANNEEGYKIERGADDSSFVEIGATGPDVTAFTDADILSVSAYFYRVRAYNAAGNSGYSNIASASPLRIGSGGRCGSVGLEGLLPFAALWLFRRRIERRARRQGARHFKR